MTKGKAFLGLGVVVAAAAGAMAAGLFGPPEEVAKWFPPAKWFVGDRAAAQGPAAGGGARAVAVEVATAVRKKTPVILEALGNVTMMASVAIKARIDNEIVGIHFTDGAYVKKGDLLVTLDPRMLQAQIGQAEASIAEAAPAGHATAVDGRRGEAATPPARRRSRRGSHR